MGIILIYFIGKSFYTLAGDHNRSQWGFAILGVVTYYAAIILAQLGIVAIMVANGTNLYDINDLLIGVISIPFGLGAWWALHSFLKKKWGQNPISAIDSDILDEELLED